MSSLYSAFRKGFIAIATIGFMAISAPAQAMILDFDFSFDSNGNSVSGTIFGLDDTLLFEQEADRVVVSSLGLGLSQVDFLELSQALITNNRFTLVAGELTRIRFSSQVGSLWLELLSSSGVGTGTTTEFGVTSIPNLLSISRRAPVSTVPLPSAGVLFASGLVVLAAMRRRGKKRVAA